ncbi:single-stranded DNA-binding protein, partial [Xanthomonas citri pv. citri]|nr:single-stranded DNA-binding protein [Xanthomonas citri pv. citri]
NGQGEWVSDTQWHNLVFWGRQAVFAEKSLTKGSEIAIEGKLVNRQYVDKEGITRYVTEVNVNEVLLLSRKPE